jgi:hypothetical protein
MLDLCCFGFLTLGSVLQTFGVFGPRGFDRPGTFVLVGPHLRAIDWQ